MVRRKIIYGCESRGEADSPFLTRWTLLSTRWGNLYVHRFHRPDSDEMHDHPWPFVSLILWRGYVEETPLLWADGKPLGRRRRRVWPGMVLRRPAEHVHRVELVEGREAWTLIWVGKRKREWGFWTKKGWQQWVEYFKEIGC